MSDKNIVITGSSGFIGKRLVNAIGCLSNNLTLLSRTIEPKISHHQIECDIVNDDLSLDYFCNVDIVFHLAGCAHDISNKKSANYYYKVNVEATIKLAELAIKNNVKKFVYISSVKAGLNNINNSSFSKIDDDINDIYGLSKLEAEMKLLEIDKKSTMSIIIVRPALVYGPEVKGNLGLMLSGIKHGWFPPLPKIKNSRSMVHIDDLIGALIFLVNEKSANGNTYIITDGFQYTSREIYEILSQVTSKKPYSWSVPKLLFDLVGYLHPNIRSKVNKIFDNEMYNSDKIRSLGFKPNKSLKDINETIY
ncbi:NAD-dependent epimerase/dehydratase family protein [Candidatus Pseudothioglobus singularis]|uniref:NAD-dependent epimerase/dehydratase domain-containing protein n=1 Tax=Candidatus Pseudothioglobus singularis PS1 TaxID=1125411 RepID=A0A0M4L6X0_9GAMM|nr:NAD-dependent epimerase/dehydratase family protein [Candidatus Pseudothioglobus singularis]ALE02763.1 hypothetical protein W908_06965 [Candidatus Pseudothioglobus singularis PS1]